MIDHQGGSHLCRNLEASIPGATQPIFWKYVRNCSNKVCIKPSFEDHKSQLCHALAQKMLRLRKSPHMRKEGIPKRIMTTWHCPILILEDIQESFLAVVFQAQNPIFSAVSSLSKCSWMLPPPEQYLSDLFCYFLCLSFYSQHLLLVVLWFPNCLPERVYSVWKNFKIGCLAINQLVCKTIFLLIW